MRLPRAKLHRHHPKCPSRRKLPEPVAQAFLVLYIQVTPSPARIERVDLFSEETPTCHLTRIRQFTVATGYGKDFQEGIDDIQRHFHDSDYLKWTVPFMSQSTRVMMGLDPG